MAGKIPGYQLGKYQSIIEAVIMHERGCKVTAGAAMQLLMNVFRLYMILGEYCTFIAAPVLCRCAASSRRHSAANVYPCSAFGDFAGAALDTALPSELYRAGRFQALWYSFLLRMALIGAC